MAKGNRDLAPRTRRLKKSMGDEAITHKGSVHIEVEAAQRPALMSAPRSGVQVIFCRAGLDW